MEAYTFGLKIVSGGSPSPDEMFKIEINAFASTHKDATVQNCSMTTFMSDSEKAKRVGGDGWLFGVIFYDVKK